MRKLALLPVILIALGLILAACNSSPVVKKIKEKKTIAFKILKEEDPTMDEGQSKVKSEGKKGLKVVSYEITYVNDEEKSRKVLGQKILRKPKAQIMLMGTLKTENSTPEPIPFETQNKDDPEMEKGKTKVIQEGAEGKKVKVYKVGYKDGQEVSREFIEEKVTKEPTPKVIANGTKVVTPPSDCDPNYSGCVPIASDVDCAGGSGNGPAYVQGPVSVIGSDIYGLDSDGDGIGCE